MTFIFIGKWRLQELGASGVKSSNNTGNDLVNGHSVNPHNPKLTLQTVASPVSILLTAQRNTQSRVLAPGDILSSSLPQTLCFYIAFPPSEPTSTRIHWNIDQVAPKRSIECEVWSLTPVDQHTVVISQYHTCNKGN